MTDVLLIDPLARGTGHHSWYLSSLGRALGGRNVRVRLLTFTGMYGEREHIAATQQPVLHASKEGPRLFAWVARRVLRIPPETLVPSTMRGQIGRLRYAVFGHWAILAATVVAAGCKRRQPSLVLHFLSPLTLPALLYLAVIRRPTSVAATVFRPPPPPRGVYARMFRRLYRSMASRGRIETIAQTPQVANAWAELTNRRVHVLPLPAERARSARSQEAARQALGLPLGRPIVAVLGAITPAKGFVELFNALSGHAEDWLILLAGDFADWRELDPRRVAEDAGLTESTIFWLRFLTDAELSLTIEAVSVVSLLYRQPDLSSGILTLCYERGTPVLATGQGHLGEFVRRTGAGAAVNKDNPIEVREGLRRLLAGGGSRNPDVAPPPTWVESADAHLEVYGTAWT